MNIPLVQIDTGRKSRRKKGQEEKQRSEIETNRDGKQPREVQAMITPTLGLVIKTEITACTGKACFNEEDRKNKFSSNQKLLE